MTAPYFVDANVIVYALDPRDPRKRLRAANWLDHLWQHGLGRTSAQVISESYATLRRLKRDAPPEDLWEEVEAYLAWNPQPVNDAILIDARAVEIRWKLSWWDSLIVAAARSQGCAVLLTEDLQDGAVIGSVTVRSPFTLELREPKAAYAAAPGVASLHRPRGRPRRTALA